MQCVCSDQLNIQLKAVLVIKHLAAEVVTFQQYFQSCQGALRILTDIATPPILPQARSLEPLEVKTVREATQSALDAVRTPHTIEKQTESAHLKERIQGFGNYQPPPEESVQKTHGVTGQVAEFVGDSVGDMVDDFREKGAVGALKDATVDALDLVLDGVDAIWGWVAGKGHEAPRICQPQNEFPLFPGHIGANGMQRSPGAFVPPTLHHPTSASNHYAAAFSGGVVGANHQLPSDSAGRPSEDVSSAVGGGQVLPATAPTAPAPAPTPAPMEDLLTLDVQTAAPTADHHEDLIEVSAAQCPTEEPAAAPAAPEVADLLGDFDGSAAPGSAAQDQHNMLDI